MASCSWILVALAVGVGCGRIGFELAATADSSGAGGDGGPDGSMQGDGGATATLIDNFDRPDSTNLGPNWVEGPSAGGFSISGNALRWDKGGNGTQDCIWFAQATSSLDQWLCVQIVSYGNLGQNGFTVAVRGSPAGPFFGLTAHPPMGGAIPPTNAVFERFIDTGFDVSLAPDCTSMGTGISPGTWLCGAVRGTAAGTSARIWKFAADPGVDPAMFPAPTCEWTGAPMPDDTTGFHVGLGVWTGSGVAGSNVTFDNARAGVYP